MSEIRQPLPVGAVRLRHCEHSRTWVFFELDDVRREAQAEADLAYEAWCHLPGADAYAVYRAAQDRADAAQDQLAAYARSSHGDR